MLRSQWHSEYFTTTRKLVLKDSPSTSLPTTAQSRGMFTNFPLNTQPKSALSTASPLSLLVMVCVAKSTHPSHKKDPRIGTVCRKASQHFGGTSEHIELYRLQSRSQRAPKSLVESQCNSQSLHQCNMLPPIAQLNGMTTSKLAVGLFWGQETTSEILYQTTYSLQSPHHYGGNQSNLGF